jgi:hypothetical protein
MIYDKGHYTLRSGRLIPAYGGILGLTPPNGRNSSSDVLALHDRYDGVRHDPCAEGNEIDLEGSRPYKLTQDLTQEERYEIAVEMIHRWLRWAEGRPRATPPTDAPDNAGHA